jgi:hypothetical protein
LLVIIYSTNMYVCITVYVINRELYRITDKCKKQGLVHNETEKRHKFRFLIFTKLITFTLTYVCRVHIVYNKYVLLI